MTEEEKQDIISEYRSLTKKLLSKRVSGITEHEEDYFSDKLESLWFFMTNEERAEIRKRHV